ncbi:MAG: DivIVA domain-containing protein [Solirubrobacteraceae bacterium]
MLGQPPAQPEEEKPGDAALARPPEPDLAADPVELAGPPGLVPAELRDVSFGLSLRGYDRTEVDAYVERVNRVVAELEVSRSPQSAVKLALDRVGEQTAGVLQRAREAAEELTSTTVAEAEHAARRAHVEAAELTERADRESRELIERATEESEGLLTRAHREAAERLSAAEARIAADQAAAEERLEELECDIEEARSERERVLEEIRATAAGLDAFAGEFEGTAPLGDRGEPPSEQPTEVADAIEPASGAMEPASGAMEPASGAVEPASGAVEPASGAVEPASGAVEPSSGAVEPEDAEEAGSAPATRRLPTRSRQPRPPRPQASDAGRETLP